MLGSWYDELSLVGGEEYFYAEVGESIDEVSMNIVHVSQQASRSGCEYQGCFCLAGRDVGKIVS